MSKAGPKTVKKSPSRSLEDELDTHALAIISYLYNRVVSGAAPALRKGTGLSLTEARIIFDVGAAGFTTGNKLAKSLGLDKAAISRGVNRLIELGLMISEQDPHHRARNLLSLTDEGQHSRRLVAQFTFAREKHLLNVLTADEQRQFIQSLRKILTNVDAVNKLVAQGYFWD